MKIGLIDQSVKGWSAGASYTRMMLKSIALLPSDGPEWIFLRTNPAITAPDRFSTEDIAGLTSRQIQELCEKLAIDSVLPVRDQQIDFGRQPVVGWIPDLQPFRLPELFSESDLKSRKHLMAFLFEKCQGLMFSSEDARRDFAELFPNCERSTHIARFASTLWENQLPANPGESRKKFNLPDRFLMVPNQFWKHKNHEILPPALAAADANIHLVVCGLPSDYRDPENRHLSAFFQDCARFNVSRQVTFLGHLPYSDMLNLMRSAVAILQPSRFEGWSTSIEDAKALGKPLICSNISVHLEQAPSAHGFFGPDDPPALGALMNSIWKTGGGFDPVIEAAALTNARSRSRDFGQRLLEIAIAATENPRYPEPVGSIKPSPQRPGLLRRLLGR